MHHCYTAAIHQRAVETLWFSFWGAFLFSIFLFSSLSFPVKHQEFNSASIMPILAFSLSIFILRNYIYVHFKWFKFSLILMFCFVFLSEKTCLSYHLQSSGKFYFIALKLCLNMYSYFIHTLREREELVETDTGTLSHAGGGGRHYLMPVSIWQEHT